jgi:hypothetical protein
MDVDRTERDMAFLTRAGAAQYVREELGLPMGLSTMARLCGEHAGPPVARWWGKRPLYTVDAVREWALGRLRSSRPASAGRRS